MYNVPEKNQGSYASYCRSAPLSSVEYQRCQPLLGELVTDRVKQEGAAQKREEEHAV